MKSFVRFVKPVEFIDVKVGDVFEVKTDFDNLSYIQIRKQKFYLTEKRIKARYFEPVPQ